MALSADGLADAIFTEMKAVYDGMDQGEDETKKYLKVFSTGIIKYLTANMDVLPGSFNIPTAGKVVGTGTVK